MSMLVTLNVGLLMGRLRLLDPLAPAGADESGYLSADVPVAGDEGAFSRKERGEIQRHDCH